MFITLQKMLNLKNVMFIDNFKLKINQILYFKEPLKHPVTKEEIKFAKIINFNKKENKTTFLIADGISYNDNLTVSSWTKIYTNKELLESFLIK